jgi:ADP-ribose pyrophosphatase
MKEKTLKTSTVFSGKLLKVEVLDVELESGVKSRREIVRHPGAVAVLAERPDGKFVFVRQYRKPIEQELLEMVAGTLDFGENPDACARRELKEETGYDAAELKKLGVIALAPGYSDERLHLYYAKLVPARGTEDPDEDEHLEVVCLTAAEFERLIRKGEIEDSKTLAAWLLHTRKIA